MAAGASEPTVAVALNDVCAASGGCGGEIGTPSNGSRGVGTRACVGAVTESSAADAKDVSSVLTMVISSNPPTLIAGAPYSLVGSRV